MKPKNIFGKSFEKLPVQWRRRLLEAAESIPGHNIGIGVSGGGDSVALLRFLLPLHESGLCRLTVLHVDHGWRPESASEALWVRNLAENFNLPFRCAVLPKRKSGESLASSEAGARTWRFAAFAKFAEEAQLDAVALGHTADDQCETLLMRLLRGTSLRGLAGIRRYSSVKTENGILQLWRPLLQFTRADLRGLLKHLRQTWLEDSSNNSDKYLRNKIRRKVVPLLESFTPGLINRVYKLTEDLNAASEFIRKSADAITARSSPESFAFFGDAPDFVLREALKNWLIEKLAIKEPQRAMLESLLDLLRTEKCGRSLVAAGRKIVRTADGLSVIPQTPSLLKPIEMPLLPCQELELQGRIYKLSPEAPSKPEAWQEIFWIDKSRYNEPFVLRTRRPGDRFRPFGGAGGKKLARWLIDKQIPRHLRDNLIVLACGSDVILIYKIARADGVFLEPKPGRVCLTIRESER